MAERRRPSTRRGLAAAAAPVAPRPAVDDRPAEQTPATSKAPRKKAPRTAPSAPEPTTKRPDGVKYTAVLDHDTADAFELLTRVARRRIGRHVDKVEVLRALLLLAADDATLRDQIIDSLPRSTP